MTQSSNQSPGFSLIEMMVVLAILGGLAAIAAPRFTASHDRMAFRLEVFGMVAALNEARQQARREFAVTTFMVDVENRTWAGAGGDMVPLPQGFQIAARIASVDVSEDGTGLVRFYPDGSSTGARIGLRQGDNSAQLEVDWLTGRADVYY